MENIGKMTLRNRGGFAAKLQFALQTDSGWQHIDGSQGITNPMDVTLDPGEFGVPDGGKVSIYVFVVWGADKQGSEVFTYTRGSPHRAEYTITGATLTNTLTFDGIK